MLSSRLRLVESLMRYTAAHVGEDHFYRTELPRLLLMRTDGETQPRHALYEPALCINVQGAKKIMLEDRKVDYGEMQYMIVSVDMPIIGHVSSASPGKPFLSMILGIDHAILRAVMDQVDTPDFDGRSSFSVSVGTLDEPLTACLLRLMELLDKPQDIPVLYPLIAREIYYRILTGGNGAALARLALPGSHAQRIAQAIHVMRSDFAKPIRIEDLAAKANMSPSSFHAHFKEMTSMSPLQFQKQLRLLEARRLMTIGIAASRAAYEVGYESASQFSREYARMFGAPPKRDVDALRAATG